MRRTLFLSAALVALSVGVARAQGPRKPAARPPAKPGKPSARWVSFPEAGVRLLQPPGFGRAERFDGFQQPGTNSSVMVTALPGPYQEISKGFTAEQMKGRGMTLLSRKEWKVGGKPGLLIHFAQSAYGTRFLKWAMVFGTASRTVLVTATFPEAKKAALSAPLKASVLSVAETGAVSTAAPDVGFTVAASPKLKLVTGVGKMLAYSREGKIPLPSPEEPLFIAARSLAPVVAADRKETARKRVLATAKTTEISPTTHEPVTVDGLEGFETVADAKDQDSGTPVVLYQVMLFEEQGYVLMQGLVGARLREEYLPEFRAMARSFRQEPQKP